ncbi:tail collar domain protein [Vibrio phage 2.275.O._10N.286.54.E11]|nr:tail collar domain protein [Vibrio phage 2.275.O._10N.286.54.E11]
MASNYGIQFKRTTVPQSQPEITQITEGELAINLVDKKLYTKYNNEIINIGFDFDTYVGNQFLSRTGGPLSGLLSFDTSQFVDLDDEIYSGSSYNLVHKGYVQTIKDELELSIETRVPAGSIVVWYNSTPIPDGWEECNGDNDNPNITPVNSAVGTTTYPYIIKK